MDYILTNNILKIPVLEQQEIDTFLVNLFIKIQ